MRHFLFASISLASLVLCNFASAQGSFGYSYSYTNSYTDFGFANTTRSLSAARYDSRVDPALLRAARLADQRAGNRTTLRCWHFVKDALVQAGAVRSRPTSAYAIQAGAELVRQDGFVRLNISDPYHAPIGAVIVYAGYGGAGHVELRTARGFASDYHSRFPCRYPMIGVYVKLAS